MNTASTGWLLILPIIVPMAVGAIGLVIRRHPHVQMTIGMVGLVAHFATAILLLRRVLEDGMVVTVLGGWVAPYGIVLAADLFGAAMVCISSFMALLVAIYALAEISKSRIKFGVFTLYHMLLAGVCGAFLTGDIFNLYVWFEVMLMSSFVLLVLGGGRSQIEGAVKYVTLNLFSSVIFLSAVGILYGKTGSLNFADLAVILHDFPEPRLITALSLMFLISFGIKAGLFPLFFWLPASYHTPPVPVTTIFSALLTKVGVFAMIRTFTLVFTPDPYIMSTMLAWIAGLTMVTGVLGAVAQYDFRRLLAFHIISQIGYLMMGLSLAVGAATPQQAQLALAATVFFMFHVIISKSALFLVAGIAHRTKGTFDLKQLGGLYREKPFLSILFLIAALALAGIPPLSGFFAKFALIRASLEAEAYGLAFTALAVSILTLYSMIKIWTEAFWKDQPETASKAPALNGQKLVMYGPVVLLAVIAAGLGIYAEPVADFAMSAAAQMLDKSQYVEAVMGIQP